MYYMGLRVNPVVLLGSQVVSTLHLKYLYRDYVKAKIYTSWAHGPLG